MSRAHDRHFDAGPMKLDHCYIGDCRFIMQSLINDDVKVQTIVTSPPYWGLRDYGVEGQIGLERDPVRYLARMRSVFRLCWQLLADDGTLWLNMGDCYHNPRTGGGIGRNSKINGKGSMQAARDARRKMAANRAQPVRGLKQKDLVGMPWLLALALRSDPICPWYLRRDIIWHKPNPMPESAEDRPTTAHEYIFLLSKSERYYYDAEAIKETASPNTHARMQRATAAPGQIAHGGLLAPRENCNSRAPITRGPGQPRTHLHCAGVNPKAVKAVAGWRDGPGSHETLAHNRPGNGRKYSGNGVGFGHGYDKDSRSRPRARQNPSFSAATSAEIVETRNKRSVWTVPTQPFEGAHFATFPEKLIEPCILAGSRPGDIVFDPFMGAGTVAAVATRLGRHWLGAELNPTYAAMGRPRVAQRALDL